MGRRRSVLAMFSLALLLGLPAAAAGAGPDRTGAGRAGGVPVDLLPDLRMAKLYGFDLEERQNGHVRLHFGTIGWNMGDGPLEARGKREGSSETGMRVRQRIYDSDGGFRSRQTPAVMFYAGDGHDHWHLRQFMYIQLYVPGDPSGDVYGLRKLGYCLIDARQRNDPPAGSPPLPVYPDGNCGTASSTFVQTGLSVGWGDDYPPAFAHQWIDVTDLPAGDYRICSSVDALGDFVESDESNNQRWTDVHIDVAAGAVTALDTAMEACGPGVP